MSEMGRMVVSAMADLLARATRNIRRHTARHGLWPKFPVCDKDNVAAARQPASRSVPRHV